MVVSPNVPAKTVRELIDYAKANPGKLNFASSGIGTSSHLAGELFKSMANIEITHVPYRGNALALQDVIAGTVQISIDAISALLPHARSGALRAARRRGSGTQRRLAGGTDYRRNAARV